MTRDQERARELVSLIEGTKLACEMDDRNLVITSEMGQRYIVDREGRWSCNNGHRGDLTSLEMEADRPFWSRRDDPYDSPSDAELYEDIFRREEAKPLTDYHSDRWAEMAEERRQTEYEESDLRRREAA